MHHAEVTDKLRAPATKNQLVKVAGAYRIGCWVGPRKNRKMPAFFQESNTGRTASNRLPYSLIYPGS